MKQTRSYHAEDGTVWRQEFGYCRENNARMLGYAANVLAALLGFALLFLGRSCGLYMVMSVGASFGFAHFAESRFGSFAVLYWAAIAATVAAYLIALLGA